VGFDLAVPYVTHKLTRMFEDNEHTHDEDEPFSWGPRTLNKLASRGPTVFPETSKWIKQYGLNVAGTGGLGHMECTCGVDINGTVCPRPSSSSSSS